MGITPILRNKRLNNATMDLIGDPMTSIAERDSGISGKKFRRCPGTFSETNANPTIPVRVRTDFQEVMHDLSGARAPWTLIEKTRENG